MFNSNEKRLTLRKVGSWLQNPRRGAARFHGVSADSDDEACDKLLDLKQGTSWNMSICDTFPITATLSCWFTFFGSIFMCWHDEKRWLHSKTLLYQYSFHTNVQWAKIISEGALLFSSTCVFTIYLPNIHIKLCNMKIKKYLMKTKLKKQFKKCYQSSV